MTQKRPIEPTPPAGTKWRRSPCRASGGDERSKELADRIRECSRSISSMQRDLLADVAEFDQAEAWRGDGAVSMTAWLTERCAVSGATARVWTQTASKLESLPRLADALAEGTLSLDVLSPLAQVATPATEKDLATKATHWSVKQVRELAASRKDISNEAAARDFEHRTLRLNDAKCSIWASLPKDDYALAKARLIADVRDRTDAEGFQTGVRFSGLAFPSISDSATSSSTSSGQSTRRGPRDRGRLSQGGITFGRAWWCMPILRGSPAHPRAVPAKSPDSDRSLKKRPDVWPATPRSSFRLRVRMVRSWTRSASVEARPSCSGSRSPGETRDVDFRVAHSRTSRKSTMSFRGRRAARPINRICSRCAAVITMPCTSWAGL